MDDLASRLKAARTAAGHSQKELARLAKVAQATISDIEGGKITSPQLAVLQKLADALGTTIDALTGLGSIAVEVLAAPPSDADPGVKMLALCQIHPSPLNPRKHFDEDGIKELANSISAQGLLQNLVVRRRADSTVTVSPAFGEDRELPAFDIVAGERRWRALRALAAQGKWDPDALLVPCRVLDVDDAQHLALALLENLQRKDVNAMEEAEAFAQLQQIDPKRWSPKTIAEQIGCSARHVQQRLALVGRLSDAAQDALRDGKITFTQARVLTMAPVNKQAELVKDAAEGRYPTADSLRAYILLSAVPVSRAIFPLDSYAGEIIENPETGTKYFASKNAFLDAQKTAAQAKVDVLRQEWKWAQLVEWFSSYDYEDQRSTDRSAAGCVVVFDRWEGKVRIEEGVVLRDRSAEQARRAEDDAQREAKQKAHDAFKLQLLRHMGEEPATMMRLVLLDRITEGMGRVVSSGYYSGGLNKAFFNGGPLAPLAGLVARAQSDGSQYVKTRADLPAAWAALERIPDDTIALAFAASVAANLSLAWGELHPAIHTLSRRWKVAIPEHLRPAQADIEDATAEAEAEAEANAVRDAAGPSVPRPAAAPLVAPKSFKLMRFLILLHDQIEMALSDFLDLVDANGGEEHKEWLLASGYVERTPPEDPDVDEEGIVLTAAGMAWIKGRSGLALSNPALMAVAEPAAPVDGAACTMIASPWVDVPAALIEKLQAALRPRLLAGELRIELQLGLDGLHLGREQPNQAMNITISRHNGVSNVSSCMSKTSVAKFIRDWLAANQASAAGAAA
ncbi:ParB/RepB/Spo0J family partition protein [Arenibaculum sp.]|jgi:ParB family chromosome partitioning protein|uniref:ParB/RepB/Spo0J family partition protein n=1 Tax=Arenibaculum sp. TaxID=2865862 RepID=UPI002E1620C0|nr:ParB/RepB/Spo0J family partition protein [Arenibaculum sp.]